jgi:hypothetical protein
LETSTNSTGYYSLSYEEEGEERQGSEVQTLEPDYLDSNLGSDSSEHSTSKSASVKWRDNDGTFILE